MGPGFFKGPEEPSEVKPVIVTDNEVYRINPVETSAPKSTTEPQAIPREIPPAHWHARIAKLTTNPAGLGVTGLGVVILGFAFLGGSEPRAEVRLPPPIVTQGFPEPNFGEARKIAVTDTEVQKILDRHTPKPAMSLSIQDIPPPPVHHHVEHAPADVHVVKSITSSRSHFQLALFAPPDAVTSSKSHEEKITFHIGTRIPVILDMGISSVRHGVVLARTAVEIQPLSGRALPQGTVFRGVSSSGHERIFVDFTRVILDGKPFAVQGLATADKQIGVPAIVRKTTLEDRSQSRFADGALEALKSAANVVGNSVAQGVARGTSNALGEVQRDIAPDRSVILEASAGTRFEIVITDG